MRVFLLGPGYYEGETSRRALHDRLRLAEALEPHEVSIMELVQGETDLVAKFKRLMASCDEILVWLPADGKLSTVFGELLIMRYEEAWHGKAVWILAEEGVLDAPSDEFRVLHKAGQLAYLLDLATHYQVRTLEYETLADASHLARLYAAGSLASD